jgi:hypothetical protein
MLIPGWSFGVKKDSGPTGTIKIPNFPAAVRTTGLEHPGLTSWFMCRNRHITLHLAYEVISFIIKKISAGFTNLPNAAR